MFMMQVCFQLLVFYLDFIPGIHSCLLSFVRKFVRSCLTSFLRLFIHSFIYFLKLSSFIVKNLHYVTLHYTTPNNSTMNANERELRQVGCPCRSGKPRVNRCVNGLLSLVQVIILGWRDGKSLQLLACDILCIRFQPV